MGLEVRTEEAQGAGVASLLGVEFLQEIKQRSLNQVQTAGVNNLFLKVPRASQQKLHRGIQDTPMMTRWAANLILREFLTYIVMLAGTSWMQV